MLYDRSWGDFDLACGTSITSVYGGVSDLEKYIDYMDIYIPSKTKPVHLSELTDSDKNLVSIYQKIKIFQIQIEFDETEVLLLIDKIDNFYKDDWQ